MIPYGDFSYFALMLYPVIPTIILGLLGRINWRWVFFITLVVLAVQFARGLNILPETTVLELWLVLAYAVPELAVAEGFLYLRKRAKNKWVYYGALGLSLLPLVISKFTPLVAPKSLIGFLGISYVTFRSLDVIFGIQDGLITTLPPLQYLGFVFFFPTISSGPIDRFRRFSKDWEHTRTRPEFLQDLDGAVHRLFTGFLYKFILAALIKTYWLDPMSKGSDVGTILMYMYAYSFYLFFDFAGYTQFALAFSYLFGIHSPENFNRPFLAKDIRDFWNRWHMSLSSWFRDHIYMRFVIAATKGKWFKGKYTASYLGFFVMFGLMGLWHGPAPQYLIYGAYHAVLFTFFDWFQRWNKVHKLWGESLVYQVCGIFLTFNAVCFGFLIFSGRLF
ncbi:MAG: D-alanyl-lipoteichoic acid biosynthesis protein DltB [Anaerolineae bacterium]